MLNYKDALNLDKGDRVEHMLDHIGWVSGEVVGKATNNGGPSLWVRWDSMKTNQAVNLPIATNVTEDSWNREGLGRRWKRVGIV